MDQVWFRESLIHLDANINVLKSVLIPQHEDGFTSGMAVAAHHLGVSPPFSIASAERAVPGSSFVLTLLINTFEAVRKACERPWELLMFFAVASCMVLEWAAWGVQKVIKGRELDEVVLRIDRARKLVVS